jgi:outer membrane protein TolC
VGLGAVHLQLPERPVAAESAEQALVSTERDVVLEAKLAFFGLIAAEKRIRVGETSVTTFAQELEQTRAFLEAGLRTGIDVATAASGLANAQLTLARARADAQTAEARLALALGEEGSGPWRLRFDPGLFELQPEDETRIQTAPQALVAVALRQRSEPRETGAGGEVLRSARQRPAGAVPAPDHRGRRAHLGRDGFSGA